MLVPEVSHTLYWHAIAIQINIITTLRRVPSTVISFPLHAQRIFDAITAADISYHENVLQSCRYLKVYKHFSLDHVNMTRTRE